MPSSHEVGNAQRFEAAESALTMTNAGGTRFLAARSLIAAGEPIRARAEAARLSLGTFETRAEPETYAKILEAEIALQDGDARNALRLLTEANALIDTWIAHFDLGLAYLNAGAFARAEAEFDRCLERRGEALSLMFDESPTYGYLAPVFYYQGRAREELTSERFRESYRAYLELRGKSTEDPVAKELARKVDW